MSAANLGRDGGEDISPPRWGERPQVLAGRDGDVVSAHQTYLCSELSPTTCTPAQRCAETFVVLDSLVSARERTHRGHVRVLTYVSALWREIGLNLVDLGTKSSAIDHQRPAKGDYHSSQLVKPRCRNRENADLWSRVAWTQ